MKLTNPSNPILPVRLTLAGLLVIATIAASLLAGCGGGSSTAKAFHPRRMITLGDEFSALEPLSTAPAATAASVPEGRHYGFNGYTNGVYDCTSQEVWTQWLASTYGFVFAECNPASVANPQAVMLAKPGAKVADIQSQIDGVAAAATAASAPAGDIGSGDIVSFMIGANDVIAVYKQYFGNGAAWTQANENSAIADLRARGDQAATLAMALMDRGAKLIVSTAPDLGLSPFAATEKAIPANADRDRAALLTALSFEFNAHLRIGIDPTRYDGRDYGLVLADEAVEAINSVPTAYGLTVVGSAVDTSDAACTSDTWLSSGPAQGPAAGIWCYLPYTSTDGTVTLPGTLASGADGTNHMWATDILYGAVVQQQIGIQAQARAQGNPF